MLTLSTRNTARMVVRKLIVPTMVVEMYLSFTPILQNIDVE